MTFCHSPTPTDNWSILIYKYSKIVWIKNVSINFFSETEYLAFLINNNNAIYICNNLNLDRLNQIAEVFGISTQDILNFDENVIYNIQNMTNSAPHGTVNNYSLSDEERRIFNVQIEALTNLVEKQNKLIDILLKKNK